MAESSLQTPTTVEQACPQCGKAFRPQSRRNVYCSIKCGAQARSLRNAVPLLTDATKLAELYIDHTAEQIARMVGRSRKIVELWLHRHGIPTRHRGTHKNCRRIKKGDPNPMQGRHHSEETRRAIGERQGRAWAEKHLGIRPMHDTKKGRRRGPDHYNWKGGISPGRAAFYSSPEWQKVARRVLKRDCRTCQICGKVKVPGDGEPFDIHHIVSFTYALLRAEITNLILFCEPCHYWVHSPDNRIGAYIEDAPIQGG